MAGSNDPRYDEQVAPKPYAFVSFPDKITRQRVPGHHIYDLNLISGSITFRLSNLTPLFVSSGQTALSEDLGLGKGKVVQAHYRINGQVAIPASTLKGAVRSVAEAVSASCIARGLTRIRIHELPSIFARNCTPKAACPACTLFGMGGREAYIGQVQFEDAHLQKGGTMIYRLPPLYRPRPGTPPYLDADRDYKGRKFFKHGRPRQPEKGAESEVVRPDGVFISKATFTNLNAEQLGLLFYSMALEGVFQNGFHLKIGSGKPACLGSLLIEPVKMTVITGRDEFLSQDASRPSDQVFEGDSLINEVRRYIRGAKTSGYILDKQSEELESILRFDPEALEDCPTGAY